MYSEKRASAAKAFSARMQKVQDLTPRDRTVWAQTMMDEGINRYEAWLAASGITLEEMAMKIWPDAPVHGPSAALQWENIPAGGANRLRQVILGLDKLSAEENYRFCQAIGRNPAYLDVPGRAEPSDPAIVEACLMYIRDLGKAALPRNVVLFFKNERRRADDFADGKYLYAKDVLTNAEYLERAFNALDRMPEVSGKDFSAEDIQQSFEVAMDTYEKYTKRLLKQIQSGLTKVIQTQEQLGMFLGTLVYYLAPIDGAQKFYETYFNYVEQHGEEKAKADFLKSPVRFCTMRLNWEDTAKAVLPGYGHVKGRQMLELFCDTYTTFRKAHRAEDKLTVELIENQDDLADFMAWRKAPRTKMFLQAEANRRLIYQSEQLRGLVARTANNSEFTI